MIESKSSMETEELGSQLAQTLRPGMTILLEGELGSGKTTFTKGVAKGLEIPSIIKSPTYTIIREYTSGYLPLYHIDLYRLSEESVEELYLDDYFYGVGITVVEWGSVAPAFLPKEYLKIEFERSSENMRRLDFTAKGEIYKSLLLNIDL